jgi:hypothetical protein
MLTLKVLKNLIIIYAFLVYLCLKSIKSLFSKISNILKLVLIFNEPQRTIRKRTKKNGRFHE